MSFPVKQRLRSSGNYQQIHLEFTKNKDIYIILKSQQTSTKAKIFCSKYTGKVGRKEDVHISLGQSVGRSNVISRVGSEIPTSEAFTVRLEKKHTTEAEAGLQDWAGLCSSVKTRPHKLDPEFLHLAQIPG